MKRQFFAGLFSLPLFLIAFSSCQKELGTIKQNEVAATPLPGQSTYCRIESLWHYPDLTGVGNEQFIQLIKYDEYENPVFITSPDPRRYPFHIFKYDSWHRLREYRGQLEYAAAFTHLYGYDQYGRISVDTAYQYGSPETDYYYKTIEKFEYDSQNRMVKAILVLNSLATDPQPDLVVEYNYDNRGNLIFPDNFQVTYDNRPSIYTTNDIWMFLARDYSVNNRFAALEYNPAGYGTKFNITSALQVAYFGFNSLHLINAQISYSCRPAYW